MALFFVYYYIVYNKYNLFCNSAVILISIVRKNKYTLYFLQLLSKKYNFDCKSYSRIKKNVTITVKVTAVVTKIQ